MRLPRVPRMPLVVVLLAAAGLVPACAGGSSSASASAAGNPAAEFEIRVRLRRTPVSPETHVVLDGEDLGSLTGDAGHDAATRETLKELRDRVRLHPALDRAVIDGDDGVPDEHAAWVAGVLRDVGVREVVTTAARPSESAEFERLRRRR